MLTPFASYVVSTATNKSKPLIVGSGIQVIEYSDYIEVKIATSGTVPNPSPVPPPKPPKKDKDKDKDKD
jgi:hypothetical protein